MQEKTDIAATAETLRAMARHESEQVHRRVSWLGMFQGFLFAALGISWGKNKSLTLIIALLGLTVALLVLFGLITATLAVRRIRRSWCALIPKGYRGPEVQSFYPDSAPWSVFIAPENLLPLAFAIAWACVLYIR